MDSTDQTIIAELRRDARLSLSELAAIAGVTRVTVRNRLAKLERDGVILGYSVVLADDIRPLPVRGIMMLGIEGRGADRIMRSLNGITAVQAVHTTNGKWDLIVELGTDTLEALDEVLARIRRIDGVTTSETNLLLATRTGLRPGR